MTQEELVTISNNPPDGSTLDSLVEIWDGKSMLGLTSLINDEIKLRAKSHCTMHVTKKKPKPNEIFFKDHKLNESSSDDGEEEKVFKGQSKKRVAPQTARKLGVAEAYELAGVMLGQSVPGIWALQSIY